MIQLGAKAWHSKRKRIMNSYILKNQEPLSNRWGIEVVTFGNNMTFLGSSRTYGHLSTQGALWLKYAVLLPKLFFFKVDSPAVWSNFLVQIYVNIQDLGLFGGSDPGTELDHLKEVKKHFKEWNSISASENARDMVLVAKPMFCKWVKNVKNLRELAISLKLYFPGGFSHFWPT